MTAAAPSRSLTPERPLSALDIADGAFALLRNRPKTVAGIAAAFVLPTQLLTSWLDRDLLAGFSFDDFDTETGQFDGQSELSGLGLFDGSPVGTLLHWAILPCIGVALTHLVLGWRVGEERSTAQCLAFTVRKLPIILVAFVLSKLVQGITLLLTTPMIMLVAPVIAAEGLGPIKAIRRAFALGRRRYGALFGLLLLLVLINVLLSYALLILPVVGAFLLDDWGWVAFFALGSVGATVLDILAAGAAVLAYIDVTNRTEGADIERRLHRLPSGRG